MAAYKYNDVEQRIADEINKYANREIYDDTDAIVHERNDIAAGIIGILVSWACKPQNDSSIMVARNRLSKFPTEWVGEKIKETAALFIDISDCWEYRRLLELSEFFSKDLLKWTLSLGENSNDLDICEAVYDFNEKI